MSALPAMTQRPTAFVNARLVDPASGWDGPGALLADVHQNVNIPLDARNANARLMAAAPELLEALQEIITAADGEGWSQLDAGFTKARAAVAKALGND